MSDDPSHPATDDIVLIEDADGVRVVTFNRPEALNAFNQALWCAVRDALAGAADDPEIRCVVITGAGRAFTAGQDLTEMADPAMMSRVGSAGHFCSLPFIWRSLNGYLLVR